MAYQKKIDSVPRCPFEYGLHVFGGKWNARVICLLSRQKALRFQQIRAELEDITDSVLSGALRELSAHGIVSRTAYNEIPPRVEYALTEKGLSIVPLLESICRWSQLHHEMNETALLSPCRQCPHRNSASSSHGAL
ncbi:MAG: helix-turn-helix transcriptional regulator [Clostridia bacterium]|nr:helix-turn-helix transcriptional regulator [Clostridia bacterium]